MSESNVRAIAITKGIEELENQSAENITSFVARVSNPDNQMNFETAPKLLGYCIRNQHWSVFEHVSLTLEITTTLAISTQILRHRSFTFQQFSGRYSKLLNYIPINARRQDLKNRQNSIDDVDVETKRWFNRAQEQLWDLAYELYQEALNKNLAKEVARFLLPLNTETKLFMTGNLRSWIHYIKLREANGTQQEHREIALQCKKIIVKYFPEVSKALEWSNDDV